MSASSLSALPASLSTWPRSRPTSAAASASSSSSRASSPRAASRYIADASSTLSGCPPKRDSTGICRVSEAHSASMVCTRSRSALSSSFQPSASLRARAAAASSQVRASCAASGRGACRAAASASKTRRRISAAALMVKVIAATSSGRSTLARSASTRWMSSSVFPDPAGACTMNERRGSSARARSARSGILSASFIGFVALAHAERALLGDAAERVLVAELAGERAALRIDPRIPVGETLADRVELFPPARQQVVPVAILARRVALVLPDELHARHQALLARKALEAQLAGLHLPERDHRHIHARERVHRQLRLVGTFTQPRGGGALAG